MPSNLTLRRPTLISHILSRDTSSSAGRGGRPRPHPRPSRACGSAPRPPPLSLHAQCADGRPGGVWAAPARLSSSTCCLGGRCASLPAGLPAPPPPAASLRSRPRPTLQSHAAPLRASPPGRPGSRPLAQVWERPNSNPPASWRPGPAGIVPRALSELSAPLCAEKTQSYTGARCLQKLPPPGSSLPQKNRRDRVPNPAEIQGLVQTLLLPGRGAR